MPKENSYTRTLLNAAEVLGGRERLAEALGVTVGALSEWMRGDSIPPFEVFSQGLDIVARGPFGRPKLRSRT
jgi:transcriptional regulator with XRE-family HTH domain